MSWRRGLALAAALAFGVLGIMGVLLATHLTGQGNQESFVENLVVPIVVGKDEKDAITEIRAAGFRPEITYRRLGHRNGRVLAQHIPNSGMASRGDSVTIVVAATENRPPLTYAPFIYW
jgi:beta-lactam-binding protein with PASTA domain